MHLSIHNASINALYNRTLQGHGGECHLKIHSMHSMTPGNADAAADDDNDDEDDEEDKDKDMMMATL